MNIAAERPLDLLSDLLKSDLDKVRDTMSLELNSSCSIINDISDYIIKSGGKRFRSVLTLSSAALCGYRGSFHIELAAAIEFFHTATLLHDDVIDNSSMRRGKSSVFSIWGNKESILAGDYLLGKAFHLIGKTGVPDIYKTISNAAVIISEGEFLQLQNTGKIIKEESVYFEIINAKTAILFASACKAGGEIAQVSDVVKENLYSYGLNLGMAFQIIDDVLDYVSDESVMGKKPGEDFLGKKTTLPVIIAYRESNSEECKFWERSICGSDKEEGNFLEALEILKKYNAIEKSADIAKSFIEKAGESLSVFEDSEIKNCLNNLLDFTLKRVF